MNTHRGRPARDPRRRVLLATLVCGALWSTLTAQILMEVVSR